ncbi:sodium/calcium exchanger 1-like isoform X2 [Syngnathus typhle]|uniref:sodium/calcium exchanger 1-like isoform X2 n=1 Tax=Syngnathus typhle TaxID=161592 RepID=UPI002A6B0B01|nr:sodium/calcium exchanger 1-like isoform X2 [Syngnathus typhle]
MWAGVPRLVTSPACLASGPRQSPSTSCPFPIFSSFLLRPLLLLEKILKVSRGAATMRDGSGASLILLALLSAHVGPAGSSAARNRSKCGGGGGTDCKDGVILSPWRPEEPGPAERVARAAVYFTALAYMFLGVSIIADRFMASIEVITSQERQVVVKKANGERSTATVRVWNETVSNLTLMALGSSAPEILLSVVEICGHNFDAGELGPNTIVGSAAFNMFVIIGLCVYVIPDGQTRRVKHLRVFFVTAAWSVFAYTWLYLILAYFSPGVVEIWEGLLTLLFFPLCVSFAYVADRRLLFYKYVYKRYRAGRRRGVIVETEGEPDKVQTAHLEARRLAQETERELSTQREKVTDWHGGSEAADGHGSSGRNVTVSDDDRAGVFAFEEPTVTVSESVGAMEVMVVRTSGARGAVAVPYRTVEGTAKGGGRDFEDTHGVLEFDDEQICQTLRINIIDDEEYEKNKTFWVEMGEPRLLEMSGGSKGGFLLTGKDPGYRKLQEQQNPSSIITIPGSVCLSASVCLSDESEDLGTNEEEERRNARACRPMLGEHAKLEVVIEESYEFKSAVDKVLKKTRLAVLVRTTPWREQFVEAITIGGGEDGEEPPSALDYMTHFLSVFWKLLFALVPPPDYWNGWACFVVSIAVIGILTAFIGDLASHFGCTVGLKDSVTAVVFVALGTSVPDTFASKLAATQDQYADASIGNVTGSNAVNVFLGIGLAWSIAAIYHRTQNQVFRVDPGTLAFSVTLFTIFAFVCIAVLIYRRRPEIGGELGGPPLAKTATAGLFFSLWLMYIVLSSLEAYCHIPGF